MLMIVEQDHAKMAEFATICIEDMFVNVLMVLLVLNVKLKVCSTEASKGNS